MAATTPSGRRRTDGGDVDRLRALLDRAGDRDDDPEVRGLKAQVVLHHMFQFTGLTDLDGTLLEANQTALEAGGIERSDVIGRPVWEAHWFTVSEDVQRRTRESIARAVASRQLVRYDEEVYAGAHGTETIPIDFSARPVLAADGQVAFLVLEGRDIAERQHARRLKDQLFANVSHELRTPLALILGRTGALLDVVGADDAVREPLERIADHARVLLGKVNDLLHLAALEAGGITVAPRPTDLAAVAGQVVAELAPFAAARDIDVRLELDGTEPVVTDPDHVRTILANLLTNASKVVDDGGVIVVAVDVRDGSGVLEVRDDGPGIPPAERDRIFDAFHQTEHTRARGIEGTGLGLAIVGHLVELLSGDVAVLDAPEGGAGFRVTLRDLAPVTDGSIAADGHVHEVASERLDALLAARRLASGRVPSTAGVVADEPDRDHLLLVEDDTDLIRFLTEQLAGTYRITVAADGQEALDLLAAGDVQPEVIVTDLMMPRMSGDELIGRLQANDALAGIPVLVLTAREDQRMRDRLLSDDAADYLVKPFSVPELRARIENLLEPVRLNRQLARSNAELQRYARQLSHDLKTPLASLVGLAETVREHLADLDPDATARMLERIVANGHRMAHFVDDLLAEVSGGAAQEAVAVGDVLAEVMALLADELGTHGADVAVPGDLPVVTASPAVVRSVLTNLLANSLNYRSPDRPLSITVTGWREGDRCTISVRDNGLGVAAEDRERIFDPGHRGSDREKQERAGSGVGLFACRQLLAGYGGDIWNVAVEPPGAEFRFTLPASGAGRAA